MAREVDETALWGGRPQVLAGAAACPRVVQGENCLLQVKPWLSLVTQSGQVLASQACARG